MDNTLYLFSVASLVTNNQLFYWKSFISLLSIITYYIIWREKPHLILVQKYIKNSDKHIDAVKWKMDLIYCVLMFDVWCTKG